MKRNAFDRSSECRLVICIANVESSIVQTIDMTSVESIDRFAIDVQKIGPTRRTVRKSIDQHFAFAWRDTAER